MSEIIIKPGLLVSLSSKVTGGVHYYKQTIEYPHLTETGEKRSKHETTTIVEDPDEHDRAEKVRSKCRSLIESVCSSMGPSWLLCPEDRKDELVERINQARELARQFNRDAVYTRVDFTAFWGVVAQDDVRAAEAVARAVRELLADIQLGLAELDAKKVRALCDKGIQMGQVLSEDSRTTTQIAIRAAREACKRIVKAGEDVAIEIDRNAIRVVEMARTSFLEIGDDDGEQLASVTPITGRAVELGA